jgi:hypothetical protein
MPETTHQTIINTTTAQADFDRVLNSTIMTSKCLEAVDAFWYPISLSDELTHPNAKIELAFLVGERKLSVYIDYSNDDRIIE